ncbi:MAG: bifunctional folylpolyglutamate synthase/dihydrofolate synthase [Halothermotrichaceae bacterium]
MDPYKYINSFIHFGSKGGYKPGLERIRALLKPFGHPENKIKTIHVAGSNGKGSTIAFLKSIYKEAGYTVGVYSSPHLYHFNERMVINDIPIKREELQEVVELIKPVVKDITATKLGKPSYFEIVTAIGFLYFYKMEVDLLLLEVGLGGRLDATNVIKSPLVSIITSISLEHTEILGDTEEKIAVEKAGIIKEKCPVITAAKDKNIIKIIKNEAVKKQAELKSIDKLYQYSIKQTTLDGQVFNLKYSGIKPEVKSKVKLDVEKNGEISITETGEYQIQLKGKHQVRNAITAITTVIELEDILPLGKKAVTKGLEKAYIPARIEVVSKNPYIICDGAHNVEGVSGLIEFLKSATSKNQQIYFIFAVLKNKNYQGMINKLTYKSNVKLMVSKNDKPRALHPDILEKYCRQNNIDVKKVLSLNKAVKYVLKNAKRSDIICVTGSLYTAAKANKLVKRYLNKV